MLIALLLAATISSDLIGQFFSLPVGISSSVASEDTPGSDPSAGGGWYVQEYTNRLCQTWDVYCNYEPTPVIQSQSIGSQPGASGTLILDVYDLGYRIWNERYYVEGEYVRNSSPATTTIMENDIEAIYDAFVETEVLITGETKRYDFTVRLLRGYEPVPTGRYIPKSPRLTPGVYAGVNSTFEAFLERQYYAGQGQSNVWDMTQWGPRDDYKRFWFDPYWMRTGGTNEEERYTYNGWDYSTNRTVMTRRLSEYEQIRSLADYFVDDMCRYGKWHMSQPKRPGWIESSEGYQDASSCWWSTTDTTVLTGTRIVPSFSWVSNPMTSADWSKCSQPFSVLENDDAWNGNEEYYDYPTCRVMSGLSFGQQTSNWDWRDAAPDDIEVSFEGLITNVFPHADGLAINKDSRRLFSDRLCCMNQALSLMDRTYHVPEVTYPTTGTNILYTHAKYWTGTMTATPVWDGGRWSLNTFSRIAWDSPTETSSMTGTNKVSSGDSIHRAISATATRVDDWYDVLNSPVRVLPQPGDEDQYIQQAISQGLSFNDGDSFFVSISYSGNYAGGIMQHITVVNISQEGSTDIYEGVPFLADEISVNVIFTYKRLYSYAHTIGDIDLGTTQPGYQSGTRLGVSKLGSVVGVHRRWGAGHEDLEDMNWSGSASLAQYKSDEYTYGGRGSLVSTARTIIGGGHDKFIEIYGADPDDPSAVVPISDSDANRVKNSIVIESGSLGFDNGCVDYATGEYSGGHAITSRYWNESNGMISEGWGAIATAGVSISATKGSPSQTDKEALHTDTKIGIITRADWNWKALKRGND